MVVQITFIVELHGIYIINISCDISLNNHLINDL